VLLCGGTHKFINKLVFFHQSVTAFAGCHFIKCPYFVSLDTRMPNEERDRFGRMRTEFAGSGMVGQYGDSNGFLPILHSLVDRTYGTAVQILNRHNLQGDISFVTGLITGLDMQVDKIIRPQCIKGGSHLILIVGIIKPRRTFYGDTGSAVANGFLGVEGIHVYVLYPKGKVSEIQEKQFTTLGQNITAIEVDGTFDDCQALVKSAFMDGELNEHLQLTSANSINVARFLPQAFYYFYAYAQLKRAGKGDNAVICVPSGNFGNITAGLFGKRMGLPVERFIASNNRNDIFFQYLQTGVYTPRPSIATIANAMDVGDPSNFARVLDLYGGSHAAISAEISGATYTDEQIAETMREVWKKDHYLLDPHGACGFRALAEGLKPGETGVFLETAHPAKFKDTVEKIIGEAVEIPAKLQAFMRGEKKSLPMSKDFADFKQYLMHV
jgi:threonine synthase